MFTLRSSGDRRAARARSCEKPAPVVIPAKPAPHKEQRAEICARDRHRPERVLGLRIKTVGRRPTTKGWTRGPIRRKKPSRPKRCIFLARYAADRGDQAVAWRAQPRRRREKERGVAQRRRSGAARERKGRGRWSGLLG